MRGSFRNDSKTYSRLQDAPATDGWHRTDPAGTEARFRDGTIGRRIVEAARAAVEVHRGLVRGEGNGFGGAVGAPRANGAASPASLDEGVSIEEKLALFDPSVCDAEDARC